MKWALILLISGCAGHYSFGTPPHDMRRFGLGIGVREFFPVAHGCGGLLLGAQFRTGLRNWDPEMVPGLHYGAVGGWCWEW